MKRAWALLISFVLVFGLCACSGAVDQSKNEDPFSSGDPLEASGTESPASKTPGDASEESSARTSPSAEVDPAGHIHDFGAWLTSGKATCTVGEEKSRTCSSCGATEKVYGLPNGHRMKNNECEICKVKASAGLTFAENGNGWSVTGIGGCTDSDVLIPNTYAGKDVTGIGKDAFSNVHTVETVTLHEGIVSIGENAFSNCSRLRTIGLPDSLETIGWNAFYLCINLLTVRIPPKIGYINRNAFLACYKLAEVRNESPLTILPDQSDNGHAGFYALSVITSGQGHIYLSQDGYYFFCNEETCKLLSYTGAEKDLVLPDTLYGMPYDLSTAAFQDQTELKSVKIAQGTKVIGAQAFDGCAALESAAFPESLRKIGNNAFRGCAALKNLRYAGDKAAWWKIDINSGNDVILLGAVQYEKE